ncbi:MAG: UDP-N-acetylmuramoyl-L-alanyl-D-glutamate--2,6-diaminopimelate ligase [Desulfovibrionaceae bacterium]|nr:UDP-N-acetylmuramoyl-L-alanyl-D-glutamate--2,6-diaminopimelate ligase [Desulfovibrionaceae bacterium]
MKKTDLSFSALLEFVAQKQTCPRTHSGQVRPGDSFILMPPAQAGGQGGLDYLREALAGGAEYLVYAASQKTELEARLEELAGNASRPVLVQVEDCRAALGDLAVACFAAAGPSLGLCGITGTNGKTSCTYMLEHLLGASGHKVGVIGTINYRWPGVRRPSCLTTPGCLELHSMIREMREAGTGTVIMEVSSHALAQKRVAGLSFGGALWTNLTQDHLDFHQDMEEYYQYKAALFLGPEEGGVPARDKARAINGDDAHGRRLLDECAGLPGLTIAYGLGKQSRKRHLQGEILSLGPEGLRLKHNFHGQVWEIASPLVGRFNAMNLLGVEALALALGMEPEDFGVLENFTGAPGRLERIANRQGLHIFVDYAHTPDALEKALGALRDAGFKRLIAVFGCGGNRDRGKRPLMGRVVSRLAEVAVLTSDNPRLEDPLAIIRDVLPGMDGPAERHIREDRRTATALALELAKPGDAVLVAGKGHEDYMILGEKKIHYSDQETLRELLGEAEAGLC